MSEFINFKHILDWEHEKGRLLADHTTILTNILQAGHPLDKQL